MDNASAAANDLGNSSLLDIISEPPRAPWWTVLLVSLITAVTITANGLLVIVFFMESGVRTVFNYYIFNLALADFLVGAGGMTYYSVFTVYDYWPLGYKHCTAWIYLDYMGVSESLFSLCMIASDRMWAVTWPISYRRHHTGWKCGLIISSSWIFMHAAIVPSLAFYRLNEGLTEDPTICYWDVHLQPWYASPFYVTVFTTWVPLICTLFCYMFTAWKVWNHRMRKTISSVQQHGDIIAQARFWRKERQTYLLMTLLMAALVLLWGPWFIYQAMMFYINYFEPVWFTVAYWLAYTTSGVNPFLFNIASPEMRAGVRKLLGLSLARVGVNNSSIKETHSAAGGQSSRSGLGTQRKSGTK